MKRLKILTLLAIGIMASSSGAIQTEAALFNYFVDFSTKEVANFSAYKQSFNVDTYNLDTEVNFEWAGNYRFDTCPTAFVSNASWNIQYRINATGTYFTLATVALPDFVCTTTLTPYFAEATAAMPAVIVEAIMNDDANFVHFRSRIEFLNSSATLARTLTLNNYYFYIDLTYDFNTTYLFNYFLSDQNYQTRNTSGFVVSQTASQFNYLEYVYSTAGDDRYTIFNTNQASIGTTRKKYAIDYNMEFFRGESVGAGFTTKLLGTDTYRFTSSSGLANIQYEYYYYFLNVANLAQGIVDAPIISFSEESCSGGFLDINVACFVNNALAYIVNDAPVISDAFTLLNTGIELAAQTFGIIANFSDDNVFGYLILVGFGFIAVKWFLKSDE